MEGSEFDVGKGNWGGESGQLIGGMTGQPLVPFAKVAVSITGWIFINVTQA